jgi:hypothetical protein
MPFQLTDEHIKSIMTVLFSNISPKTKNPLPAKIIPSLQQFFDAARYDLTDSCSNSTYL